MCVNEYIGDEISNDLSQRSQEEPSNVHEGKCNDSDERDNKNFNTDNLLCKNSKCRPKRDSNTCNSASSNIIIICVILIPTVVALIMLILIVGNSTC